MSLFVIIRAWVSFVRVSQVCNIRIEKGTSHFTSFWLLHVFSTMERVKVISRSMSGQFNVKVKLHKKFPYILKFSWSVCYTGVLSKNSIQGKIFSFCKNVFFANFKDYSNIIKALEFQRNHKRKIILHGKCCAPFLTNLLRYLIVASENF